MGRDEKLFKSLNELLELWDEIKNYPEHSDIRYGELMDEYKQKCLAVAKSLGMQEVEVKIAVRRLYGKWKADNNLR